MKYQDRVAVITGATGGLGRVVTRQLAERGFRLALFSSNQDRLESLARDLKHSPENTMVQELDFRQPGAAQKAAQATIDKFGSADILLHFVGGWSGGASVEEVAGTDLENMLQQHVWTTFSLAQAFIPIFKKNEWGRMVVISSPSASHPTGKNSPYAAAKAAQEALLLSIAQENQGSGVTANILRVQTIDVQHQHQLQPTDKNSSWTTPEEITAAVEFLISDAAVMVNGARIPLYGSP
ncbi:MAG: SDR family oxidoreductase [Anaerolineales bacterium]|nr:SDR family oxidoreductase [Anaerolineales bacterium]